MLSSPYTLANLSFKATPLKFRKGFIFSYTIYHSCCSAKITVVSVCVCARARVCVDVCPFVSYLQTELSDRKLILI